MKIVARPNKAPRHKPIAKKSRHGRKQEAGESDKSADSMDTCTTGDDESFERSQETLILPESGESQLPYSHLFFSQELSREIRTKHLLDCYFGVKHIQKMLPLTPEQLLKHKLELPTPNTPKKTLFLDLDETLIHASLDPQVRLENRFVIEAPPTSDGKGPRTMEITFTVRPYCLEFLRSVSRFYELYIFTASNQDYAKAAMDFFNARGANIVGFLAREACLKTSLGIYIKDIMRITNRAPSQMLLVDNLTHSFGHMIDNGIPVVEFVGDQADTELVQLEKYLLECAAAEDVREFNRARLRLADIVAELTPYLHLMSP